MIPRYTGVIFCLLEAPKDAILSFAKHDNHSMVRDAIIIMKTKSLEAKGDAAAVIIGWVNWVINSVR